MPHSVEGFDSWQQRSQHLRWLQHFVSFEVSPVLLKELKTILGHVGACILQFFFWYLLIMHCASCHFYCNIFLFFKHNYLRVNQSISPIFVDLDPAFFTRSPNL